MHAENAYPHKIKNLTNPHIYPMIITLVKKQFLFPDNSLENKLQRLNSHMRAAIGLQEPPKLFLKIRKNLAFGYFCLALGFKIIQTTPAYTFLVPDKTVFFCT